MSSALDRQIKPIYDALDSGSNKSAILACNKLLKKSPKNDHVKALKALALVRMQKLEESLLVCDEVLAAKPSDDGTLAAMNHALRGLGRNTDIVKMFEEAFKQQPSNEELGCQSFLACVRVSNWKSAQQNAMKLQKQFSTDRYVFWNVMSCYLQAKDPSTTSNMRPVLLKLAHRFLTSGDLGITAERFYLHLSVLKELQSWDEADTLINSEAGKVFCNAMLACDELRRETVRARGAWQQEADVARERILEKKDRNWLEFLSILDATFPPSSAAQAPTRTAEEVTTAFQSARDLFVRVTEVDGISDRSGYLALIELEKRAHQDGRSSDPAEIVNLMKNYLNRVGGKPCCFEDLKPYLVLDPEQLASWTTFLEQQPQTLNSVSDLHRVVTIQKCLRYNLTESKITAELEAARAKDYTSAYMNGLTLGANLPETEYQPADDLAILASQALFNVAHLTKTQEPLHVAVALLEYGLTKSKQSYPIRLALIRLYHFLCAPALALEHYRALSVKQVQMDTLSHLVLSRASAFSLAAVGDITLMTEIVEASQVYISNAQDTPEWISRAFAAEKYSQIPDFIDFHDRLERSLQRDLAKIELTRMRLAHEPVTSDFIDMELIELKFNFDRFHHDNRDLEIVPSYQPRCQPTFTEQTELFHASQGLNWLWVFMKSYIRALQQGSDLDDTVEEKLLIGDRPKLSNDPENKIPLKDRLVSRNDEERKDLSAPECGLYDFSVALADWLGPHHDFIRPPADEVLAQASKLNEAKTGRPLKGYAPSAGSNGHAKKDEEAPAVKDSPSYASKFFDDMASSFEDAVERQSACEALHVATITQEALAILAIETLRFKSPSTVKMHKLGNLVQSIKDIRTKAIAILKTMSGQLTGWGEREATQEKRNQFVSACEQLASHGITHDFSLNVAKKVTDARKKVLDGVGQGIIKVCTNHA